MKTLYQHLSGDLTPEENFTLSSLMCIANTLRNEHAGSTVLSIFKITINVLTPMPITTSKEFDEIFLKEFNNPQIITDLRVIYNNYKKQFNVDRGYHIIFALLIIKQIINIFKKIDNITNSNDGKYLKIFYNFNFNKHLNNILYMRKENLDYVDLIENSSWQDTDASFIWLWIHITTIFTDLNAGFKEKIAYITFISRIVTCSVCKNHYMSYISNMVKLLKDYTLADVFLILHSAIASNNTNFIINEKNFIDLNYKYYYIDMFNKLNHMK
ncbi:hypothetical protein SGHV072 [Glossina pallidipes salivary gland hypertrophy virus]|uniref:Sulfhydryl oxidase n=1 Tax=Glossina hytrovirus (isolate Glossina pallidipes/Ethiopia/Seibersdorf/-) TaxID=379529 RepID=B0YLM6_GHVS|nr:hypothetical protein SGHV072 [Glossina pallidipes salivary gland hypertrophy virus]ABQ08845.1 hypothetical protein SGHV072 [Glossina pallidipes salivary gland hypertrophy virus]